MARNRLGCGIGTDSDCGVAQKARILHVRHFMACGFARRCMDKTTFPRTRMKDNEQNEEIKLDSVPFPDDKGPDDKCRCHDHDHGEGECACEGGGECKCGEGHTCSHDAQHELLEKIDAIVNENITLREMLIRANADFDNYRKRVVREKDDARRNANADLVSALIPVLDTMSLAFEAARKHHPEASAGLDGLDMIGVQFKNVLKAQGVEEINPAGQPFDPNFHESIAHQPSAEHPEGTVCAVARTGYSLNGRLLRPATVVVSSGAKA
jgi:molecular chaperone GrpE